MTLSVIPHPSSFTTFAIIPVKPLRQAKSRLARALKPPLRAALVKSILARTLDLLAQNERVVQTVVISRDITVLRLARSKGAAGLVESESTLNAAVTQAAGWAKTHGADSLMIVPVDLPLLTNFDLDAMIDLAIEPEGVVIAPDRHDQGTNLLFIRPPDAVTFAYGSASFNAHRARAAQRRLPIHIYRSATVALDLDVPDDLALYRESAPLFDAESFSE